MVWSDFVVKKSNFLTVSRSEIDRSRGPMGRGVAFKGETPLQRGPHALLQQRAAVRQQQHRLVRRGSSAIPRQSGRQLSVPNRVADKTGRQPDAEHRLAAARRSTPGSLLIFFFTPSLVYPMNLALGSFFCTVAGIPYEPCLQPRPYSPFIYSQLAL